jgi:hypothetical protein
MFKLIQKKQTNCKASVSTFTVVNSVFISLARITMCWKISVHAVNITNLQLL